MPQTSTRFEGLSLLETGAFEQAIAIFGNLLSQDLQDPVRHIDHSRALYACQQYTEAIKGFKKAIALTRRRNRLQQEAHSNENESVLLPCVCSEDIILYSAYTYLGKCYQSLNRVDRAIASYTLAIKIFRPSDSSASYEWDVFGVGDSQSFLSQLLCCRQSEEPPTLDIEDYLKDYALTSINSPFNFNCTMCGECCRTSDRILLTPHDIFLLTRYFSLSI